MIEPPTAPTCRRTLTPGHQVKRLGTLMDYTQNSEACREGKPAKKSNRRLQLNLLHDTAQGLDHLRGSPHSLLLRRRLDLDHSFPAEIRGKQKGSLVLHHRVHNVRQTF